MEGENCYQVDNDYELSLICFLAYNVSNSLANYMTMALDFSSGTLAYFYQEIIPSLSGKMSKLNHELDFLMAKENVTIVQLFRNMAIG